MNDSLMYQTMYNETLGREKKQRDEIERLKIKVKTLTAEIELHKVTMRKELLRLHILLEQKDEKERMDN